MKAQMRLGFEKRLKSINWGVLPGVPGEVFAVNR